MTRSAPSIDEQTAARAALHEESNMYEENPQAVAPGEPRERYAAMRAQSRRKSVVLACVLSLMPGLGQIYVGYYQRGFMHVFAFAALVAILASGDVQGLAPFLGISLAFLLLYNLVDAGRRAALYNLALEGIGPERLPEEKQGTGGSLTGGVILLVIGGVLLAHLRFDMSLDWLAEWWPLGVMLFGAYLVAQAVSERRRSD